MRDGSATGRAECEFERSFAALKEVFAFTAAFFRDEGIADEDRFAVDFAIEEIFTNIVKYHAGSPHAVVVGLERSGARLRITLVDRDAEAFDPVAAPDARTDAPIEERKPGGLGIHLTRRLVDGMEYTYSDRTSTVTLTKELR